MKLVEVRSQDVRLPGEAVEALSAGTPVAVTRYGRPAQVVLSYEQFASIAPFLELLHEGALVSPEYLRSDADLALERELAEDREPTAEEEEQIAELLREGGLVGEDGAGRPTSRSG